MAGKNLLLVNPYIHDFSAYDFWMKPLGLLYLASVLNDAGYKITFIDCIDRFTPEKTGIRTKDFPKKKPDGRGKLLREEILKPRILDYVPKKFSRYGISIESFRNQLACIQNMDAVLVTSYMTYWHTGVQETIREIRNYFPKTPIILGGIYATLMPEHARIFSGADYIATGEGENRILDILEKVTSQKAVINKEYKSLDDFPKPMFSLLSDTSSLPILTTRGCPFKCRYCASGMIMPSFRRRNPFKVVDEIEFDYKNYGTTNFAFYDDALLVNSKEHFSIIMNEVMRREIKVSFHMPNAIHGKYIDEETAELMFQGGCKTIRMGLETSDEIRQKESGGKISSEEFLNAVNNLQKAGYRKKDIGVYVMMGLPYQKFEEVRNSIIFVNKAGCTIRLVSFTPIPGTEYWRDSITLKPEIAEDPLLQNNSIFPLSGTTMDWDDFLLIKQMVRELNAGL